LKNNIKIKPSKKQKIEQRIVRTMKQEDLIERIAEKKYTFIGEIHGTKEIPEKVKELISMLKKRSLIFCGEFPYQAETEIEMYLRGEITKKELFTSKYLADAIYDKRITEEILKLWSELFKRGSSIKGIEDYDLENIQERDKKMAEQFLKIIKKYPANQYILYCGGLHLLDKITKISSFTVNPIKIYLPNEIIKEAITIQFYPGAQEEIRVKDQTIEYYIPLKEINARKLQL